MRSETFIHDTAAELACCYLLVCAVNWMASVVLWRKGAVTYFRLGGDIAFTNVILVVSLGAAFFVAGALAISGSPPLLPEWIKHAVNWVSSPITFTLGVVIGPIVLFFSRRFFAKPIVAWLGLNLAIFAIGLSMTDPTFASIVRNPNNVPTLGMLFSLGFITWLWAYRVVRNDDRMRQGLAPLETVDDLKKLNWRCLAKTELFCVIALTVMVLLWGVALQAPLEDAAGSAETPNPSKAPWYFLGLQEMLVYFDPWFAGVALPGLVFLGRVFLPGVAVSLVVWRLLAVYTWRARKDAGIRGSL